MTLRDLSVYASHLVIVDLKNAHATIYLKYCVKHQQSLFEVHSCVRYLTSLLVNFERCVCLFVCLIDGF